VLWLDVHLAIGPRNTLWKLITDLNRPFIFAGEDGLHIVRHLKNDGFNQLQWNSFRNIMGVSWKNDWMYRHVRGTSLDNEIYPVVIQQFTEKSPVNHRTKSVMTRIANDFFLPEHYRSLIVDEYHLMLFTIPMYSSIPSHHHCCRNPIFFCYGEPAWDSCRWGKMRRISYALKLWTLVLLEHQEPTWPRKTSGQ
jgi:hypothetical protein